MKKAQPTTVHPFVEWYRRHSGIEVGDVVTETDLLAVDAWNAAVEVAVTKIILDGNPAIALERIRRLEYKS